MAISLLLPPLVQVECSALRADARLAALPHVAELISSFLDAGSTKVSLVQAAASGVRRVFARVAQRCEPDFLTTHASLRDHAYAGALKAAIRNDALVVAHEIHRLHPDPLAVPSLKLAFQYGSLELVQWTVHHRHDQLCCSAGLEQICHACLSAAFYLIGHRDTYRIVHWLDSHGRLSGLRPVDPNPWLEWAILQNVEMVCWLHETGWLTRDQGERVLRDTIRFGPSQNAPLIPYLVEKGYWLEPHGVILCMIHGSCQRELEPVIDALVASPLCESFQNEFIWAPLCPGAGTKVLQWEYSSAGCFSARIHELAQAALQRGRVDVLAYLLERHGHRPSVPDMSTISATDSELVALHQWFLVNDLGEEMPLTMSAAIKGGHVELLQWLSYHHRYPRRRTGDFDAAVERGHLTVLHWLHANRRDTCTPTALEVAARNGHLQVVQWLTTLRPEAQRETANAVHAAALGGHVDVLAWLCANRRAACTVCTLQRVYSKSIAPRGSVIDALRWLRAHPHLQPASCVGQCLAPTRLTRHALLDHAIQSGDLVLAQDVFTHHYTDTTLDRSEMDRFCRHVLTSRHTGLVAWLCATIRESAERRGVDKKQRHVKRPSGR